jgi:hypothetical protein
VTNVGFVAEDVDTVDSRFDSPRWKLKETKNNE